MKWLSFLVLVVLHTSASAQDDSTYIAFLNKTAELELSDSLLIRGTPSDKLLDSSEVRQWLPRLLPSTPNNRLRNRRYYLAGKITRNENFNLLMVVEEKKRTDSSQVQVVHLVSTKKDGSFIASIEAAVSGIKRRSSFDITSWIYPDYRVVKDSRITVNEKSIEELANFKINSSGRFILYPNQ